MAIGLLFFYTLNVCQKIYASPCDALFKGVIFAPHPPKKKLFIPEPIEGFLDSKQITKMFSSENHKNLIHFRKAYNRGWFNPKDIYIQYEQTDVGGSRFVYAKIIDFLEDALKIEALNPSGKLEDVVLSDRKLLETVV